MILAFLPLVLKSSKKSIMTISSNAGSYEYLDKVSQFIYGCGFKKTQIYPYRVSKAAVNFCTLLFLHLFLFQLFILFINGTFSDISFCI